MTKVLQHVLRSLRSNDVGGRSGGGPTRYWVIEDIDEFAQEFRAMDTALAKVPWATYSFTTMYEALEHAKLMDGVVHPVKEAWMFEREGVARSSGRRPEEVALRLGASGFGNHVAPTFSTGARGSRWILCEIPSPPC